MEVLLSKLNNIWIGSYKLRTYISKFDREPLPRISERAPKYFPANSGLRKQDVSFAEMVGGVIKTQGESNTGTEDLLFQSTEEESQWAKECYTGFLKMTFSWEEHANELRSECGGLLKLRSLGGNLVLLQKSSNGEGAY